MESQSLCDPALKEDSGLQALLLPNGVESYTATTDTPIAQELENLSLPINVHADLVNELSQVVEGDKGLLKEADVFCSVCGKKLMSQENLKEHKCFKNFKTKVLEKNKDEEAQEKVCNITILHSKLDN